MSSLRKRTLRPKRRLGTSPSRAFSYISGTCMSRHAATSSATQSLAGRSLQSVRAMGYRLQWIHLGLTHACKYSVRIESMPVQSKYQGGILSGPN